MVAEIDAVRAELEAVRAERRLLLSALGRQSVDRSWPEVGTVIKIATEWDGILKYGEGPYLQLQPEDEVRVEHKTEDGWLWGVLEAEDHQGWFGGPGCLAKTVVSVEVQVPLGPADGRGRPPREEFGALPDEDMRSVFPPDVQAYIDHNGLDAKAQDALRELSEEEMRGVFEGELVNCRNPSAVVLSRIKRVKNGQSARGEGYAEASHEERAPLPPPMAPAPPSFPPPRPRSRSPRRGRGHSLHSEVEAFCSRHNIDESARLALLDLPPALQQEVMDTDMLNVRNPSAVIMKRIRSVEKGRPAGPTDRGTTYSLRAEAETFCSKHGVDSNVLMQLVALPPDLQREVMDTDMFNVRNPSAVLMKRIRSVQNGLPASRFSVQQASSSSSAGDASGGAGYFAEGVEDFVMMHNLDEKVRRVLKELPGSKQHEVIDTDLLNVRNPSAVVMKRIRSVEQGYAASEFSAPPPVPDAQAEVEEFCHKHQIDENVRLELLALHPDLSHEVINTDLLNVRNPSAVVHKRIKSVEQGKPASQFSGKPASEFSAHGGHPMAAREFSGHGGHPMAAREFSGHGGHCMASSRGEVQGFCKQHNIDDSARASLLDLPPDLQRMVMETDMLHVRNPSAVIMSRIRDVERGVPIDDFAAQMSPMSPMPVGPPAYPPPPFGPPSQPPPAMHQPPPPNSPPPHALFKDPRVEGFIARYQLDDRAAQGLRDLPPHAQAAICEAELFNCRNPSAVVFSEIKKFKETGNISVGRASPPMAPPPGHHMPPPSMPPPFPPPGMGPPSSGSIEGYIRRFNLDDRVGQELWNLSPFQQSLIMQTDLTNARNPSAMVKSRIGSIKSQNQVQLRVEDYITRHGVDDSAAVLLRELPEDAQLQVIEKDLSNCRNPSAVLMKRCREARSGR